MKNILAILSTIIFSLAWSQTTLIDQRFSSTSPSGWSSTSNVWILNYNGSSTSNYRNVLDATTYSARFPSAATGNSTYLYIPVTFSSEKIYNITFFTKRACEVTLNANETANQTTLLSTETKTNSSCSSNFSLWYEWSFTISVSYSGAGYIQIRIPTVYGGPTSVYLDDFKAIETDPTPLPIELIYFDVRQESGKNAIEWKTASENNNDYFTVERSEDGYSWREIERIKGAGNSTYDIRYHTYDRLYRSTINYYRLKQTDYDGMYEYSEIKSADNRLEYRRESIKATNMLGQEIDLKSYSGMAIVYYSDGTSEAVCISR